MANRLIENYELIREDYVLTREDFLMLRNVRVAMTLHSEDENENDVRLIEKCRKVVLNSEMKEEEKYLEVKYWYNQVGGDGNEDLEIIEEMLRRIVEGGQEVEIYGRKISKEQALFLAETLLRDLAVSQPYEKMENILELSQSVLGLMMSSVITERFFLQETAELETMVENVKMRIELGKYQDELDQGVAAGRLLVDERKIGFMSVEVADFAIEAGKKKNLYWILLQVVNELIYKTDSSVLEEGSAAEEEFDEFEEFEEIRKALLKMESSELPKLRDFLNYEIDRNRGLPRSQTAIMEAELACLSSGSDEEEEDVTVTASNSTSVIRQRIREVAAELIEHLGERGMSGVAIKDVRKLEDLKSMDKTAGKKIKQKIDELQSKGLSEDFLQGAIVEEMTAKCMRDLCNQGLRWDPNRERFNSVQEEIEILQDARNQNERQVLFKLSVAEEGIEKELLGEYLQESRDRHVRYAEELSARFCEFYLRTEFSPEIVPEMLEVLLGVVSEGNTKVRFNEMNGEVDIEDALYMVFGLFEQNLGSYKPEEVKGLYQSFVVASRQVMESRKSEVSYEESEEVPDFVMPVARELFMKAEKVRLESEMREYFGGIVDGDMSLVGSEAEDMSPCRIHEYLLDLVYLPAQHDDAEAVLIFDQDLGGGWIW